MTSPVTQFEPVDTGGPRRPPGTGTVVWLSVVGGLVAMALIVAVAFVAAGRLVPEPGPESVSGGGSLEVPSVASATGGFEVGESGIAGVGNDGAPVLDVYVDYMCPYCQQFEAVNQGTLDELAAEGTITVVYHPISILDRLSQETRYSTRAAAAAATVAERAPELFVPFHSALLEQQPSEGSSGLSDTEIQDVARGVGVPDEIVDDLTDGTFGLWVDQATSEASAAGVSSVPTILLDGEPLDDGSLDWTVPGALAGALEAAAN